MKKSILLLAAIGALFLLCVSCNKDSAEQQSIVGCWGYKYYIANNYVNFYYELTSDGKYKRYELVTGRAILENYELKTPSTREWLCKTEKPYYLQDDIIYVDNEPEIVIKKVSNDEYICTEATGFGSQQVKRIKKITEDSSSIYNIFCTTRYMRSGELYEIYNGENLVCELNGEEKLYHMEGATLNSSYAKRVYYNDYAISGNVTNDSSTIPVITIKVGNSKQDVINYQFDGKEFSFYVEKADNNFRSANIFEDTKNIWHFDSVKKQLMFEIPIEMGTEEHLFVVSSNDSSSYTDCGKGNFSIRYYLSEKMY